MSILCIGQSTYDIMIPISGPIIDNRKYRIYQEYYSGGGPAFNAACLCALWGARTYLISRVGDDEYGEILTKILSDYGVESEYLIRQKGSETPYSYIFVDSQTGSRTIFNRPGKLFDVPTCELTSAPDVILTDGHESTLSIEMIKQHPRAKSIIDAGSCRESTLEVAKYVDYLVCSEDFVRQYTKKEINLNDKSECLDIYNEIKRINNRTVIVTLGGRGLLYEANGKLCHLPAYPVKVVDTTGAGDIFHGAFAYGVDQRLALLENLKQSAMAAAISIGTFGSQKSIPTLEHIKQSLK